LAKRAVKKSPARKLANDDIGEAKRIELFRLQLECRHLEQRAHELFFQNMIKGTSHLGLGQEAIAAGFAGAMHADDYTFCTYRGHNHTLVRGAPMTGVLGELMGRECGLLGGKGGSMHLTSVEHGAMGSYAIIGAHLPIAIGAAWSAQYRGTDQVAICFFGDGTTNIGAFHEALNMAQVWKLPVVFVCENNLYMEYTPIGTVTAVANPAADRAGSYQMPAEVIDGNDVLVVYDAVRRAAERARAGEGPTIIEARTYRHFGHSRTDPAKSRPADEVEQWLKHDPLDVARKQLSDRGVPDPDVAEVDERAAATVTSGVEAASAAPPADPADALTDVWADGGYAWRT
jgi:pyruvate dehydrogenase E1 component alpha subunit